MSATCEEPTAMEVETVDSEKKFPFLALSNEMQIKVFSFLNPVELCRYIMPVCKTWNELVYHQSLWKNIDLSSDNSSTKFLEKVFAWSPLLTSLRIDRRNDVDELLIAVAKSCPKLKSLHMEFCNFKDVNACSMFQANCTMLRSLKMIRCSFAYNNRSEMTFLTKFPQVRVLSLSQSYILSRENLVRIARNCQFLEEIDMDGLRTLDDRALNVLINERKTTLQKVCLDGRNDFDGECLTDRSYRNLNKCTNLTLVSITFAWKITDSGLDGLLSLENLQSLRITEAHKLTDKGVAKFFSSEKKPNLLYIKLFKCAGIAGGTVKSIALNCPSLKTLSIDDCPCIRDSDMRYIVDHLHSLEMLTVAGIQNVTNRHFLQLSSKLPSLRTLNMYNTSIELPDLEEMQTANPNLNIITSVGDHYNNDFAMLPLFHV